MGHLDGLLRTRRVDRPASFGELVGNILEVGFPDCGIEAGRGELFKLFDQQNQPQEMPEDQPLLLRQIAAGDVRVKVAAHVQQFPGGPHRLGGHVRHFGVNRVEQQSQLFGENRRAFVPRDVPFVFLRLPFDFRLFCHDEAAID